MGVISFVILHYGNVQVTKECVDSILQLHTEDDIHIVVVDNDTNKSDEERQVLKQEVLVDSRIEVLEIKEKSGFSKANNEGYAYTRRLHNPDYVIMTNNDIVFEQWGAKTVKVNGKNVTEYMDKYDLTMTVREIQDFVSEDLSNWYIRRNRRRLPNRRV